MRLFKNRVEAAKELAQHLSFLRDEKPVVLGLAPGGVPLADVIARELNAPLDVLLLEKLFAPNVPGQVVGAVDEHGRISMIQSTARWHHLNSQQLVEPAREAFRRLQQLQSRIRSILPQIDVRGKSVIVVGQGVVTGTKMLGAIAALKDRGAAKIVAAAPAGASHATWQLHEAANVVVIPHCPAKFKGIDSFYEDFNDVTDDMIVRLVENWIGDQPREHKDVQTIMMKINSSQGHALICELDLPPGAKRGSGPYPVVLFAHGFESHAHSPRSLVISRRLAQRGIIGARLDFTGHGRSEGKLEHATDVQMLRDLHVAFQSIAGLAEVDPKRMGLVGAGTGGMIALHYAAQVPSIAALVIRGPVCGRETVAARHVQAPTLLIHADADTALYDSVQTLDRELAAQHRLLQIPNANRLFNDPISMELMVGATIDWLVDHLLVGREAQVAAPLTTPTNAEPATSA